jgi:hypothetical protein
MERARPEPHPQIPAVPGVAVNVESQTLVGHPDSLVADDGLVTRGRGTYAPRYIARCTKMPQ